MTRPLPARIVFLGIILPGVLAAGLLGGCADRSPGRHATAAQTAACRQRADEVYIKQNRADLYRSDTYLSDTRDSPFANQGLPGITSRGLAGQYAHDTMITDCLNDTAGNVGNSSTEPSPQPTGEASTPGKLPRSLSPLAVPPSP